MNAAYTPKRGEAGIADYASEGVEAGGARKGISAKVRKGLCADGETVTASSPEKCRWDGVETVQACTAGTFCGALW